MTNKPAGEPPAVPSEARPASRRLLGELLVGEGLITRRQLDAALQLQAEHRPQAPLGEPLVEQGAIRPEQVYAVLDKHRLGNLLVSMELLTSEQLESALLRQRMTGRRLAEVVLQLRYVTEDQLRQALARHFGIRLVELDETPLDRGLARLIERDYAWRHRLVPIGQAGDRLTVAMDDPGDRWVIDDLARVTGCRIEVVTASSRALRRAFVRIYGDRTPASTAQRAGGPARRDPAPPGRGAGGGPAGPPGHRGGRPERDAASGTGTPSREIAPPELTVAALCPTRAELRSPHVPPRARHAETVVFRFTPQGGRSNPRCPCARRAASGSRRSRGAGARARRRLPRRRGPGGIRCSLTTKGRTAPCRPPASGRSRSRRSANR